MAAQMSQQHYCSGGGKGLTDRRNNVVLVAMHAQIGQHALDFRIANVRTLKMADQVQDSQHGH